MKKLISNKELNTNEIIDEFFTDKFWNECDKIQPSFKEYINNYINDLSAADIGNFEYGDYQIESYEFADLRVEIIEGYMIEVLSKFVKSKFTQWGINPNHIYDDEIFDLLKLSLEEKYYLDEDSLVEHLKNR